MGIVCSRKLRRSGYEVSRIPVRFVRIPRLADDESSPASQRKRHGRAGSPTPAIPVAGLIRETTPLHRYSPRLRRGCLFLKPVRPVVDPVGSVQSFASALTSSTTDQRGTTPVTQETPQPGASRRRPSHYTGKASVPAISPPFHRRTNPWSGDVQVLRERAASMPPVTH